LYLRCRTKPKKPISAEPTAAICGAVSDRAGHPADGAAPPFEFRDAEQGEECDMPGPAAVEAEDELVEIGLQVFPAAWRAGYQRKLGQRASDRFPLEDLPTISVSRSGLKRCIRVAPRADE
jgi:hypothetical protein